MFPLLSLGPDEDAGKKMEEEDGNGRGSERGDERGDEREGGKGGEGGREGGRERSGDGGAGIL